MALPKKFYYIAVEYYDKDGNRIKRFFVSGRAFSSMYSFTYDVNDAKLFGSLKSAKDYMKNYITPTRGKVFFEDCYIT